MNHKKQSTKLHTTSAVISMILIFVTMTVTALSVATTALNVATNAQDVAMAVLSVATNAQDVAKLLKIPKAFASQFQVIVAAYRAVIPAITSALALASTLARRRH